ncbi:hypothetical protein OR16_04582 [Cupriavidus basilensis OR16]|uniref:HEPN AbiU2-like domain-containing protein n=2 Tax=Cupriavidus basilensis TaxID=68895 RepID=H1S008_9BURK|nr:hypothetical protein OR16_04582 [Cupriavidus basilensis OR16]
MDVQAELEQLRLSVQAAQDEVMLAVMFHENWKPAAYDVELHERMGTSFATHSFQIIRMALRREVLMALMRVWDKDKRAVRLTAIAEVLRSKKCFEALVHARAARINIGPDPIGDMRSALEPKRDEILRLVRKYLEKGDGSSILESLRAIRHERLAHRQTGQPASAPGAEATEEQIETFYQDTLEIVRLLSLVMGHAFEIATDAAGVYRHHASFFWAAARGERTEGHPNFRRPSLG